MTCAASCRRVRRGPCTAATATFLFLAVGLPAFVSGSVEAKALVDQSLNQFADADLNPILQQTHDHLTPPVYSHSNNDNEDQSEAEYLNQDSSSPLERLRFAIQESLSHNHNDDQFADADDDSAQVNSAQVVNMDDSVDSYCNHIRDHEPLYASAVDECNHSAHRAGSRSHSAAHSGSGPSRMHTSDSETSLSSASSGDSFGALGMLGEGNHHTHAVHLHSHAPSGLAHDVSDDAQSHIRTMGYASRAGVAGGGDERSKTRKGFCPQCLVKSYPYCATCNGTPQRGCPKCKGDTKWCPACPNRWP